MPGYPLTALLDDCLASSAAVSEQYELVLALQGEAATRRQLRQFASQCRHRHEVLEELSLLMGHQPSVAWPHPLPDDAGAASEVVRWQHWERLWELEARLSQQTEALKAVGAALQRPDLVDVAEGLMPEARERLKRLAECTREAAAEAFGPVDGQRQAG